MVNDRLSNEAVFFYLYSIRRKYKQRHRRKFAYEIFHSLPFGAFMIRSPQRVEKNPPPVILDVKL